MVKNKKIKILGAVLVKKHQKMSQFQVGRTTKFTKQKLSGKTFKVGARWSKVKKIIFRGCFSQKTSKNVKKCC